MISFRDSFVLARAKLHSKKGMLVITILVSGLLFGLLYGAAIIFEGTSRSLDSYTLKANDGKYLVKSTPVLPQTLLGLTQADMTKEIISELNSMQSSYITNQKVLAKQNGVTFDEKTVEPVLVQNTYINTKLPIESQVSPNQVSPVYQAYLAKLQASYVETAKNKSSDLETLASTYSAVGYHQNESSSVYYATLSYLKNGEEDFSKLGEDKSPVNSDLSTYGYATSSVHNSNYSLIDDSLLDRFILPENEKRIANNKTALPVIITTKEAVDIFTDAGLREKPSEANKQMEWMKELQDKVNGLTYTACYRNQTEMNLLAQIAQTAGEIEKNKDNKDYTKPSLTYNTPTETCGEITVKSDTRTTQEKKKQLDTDEARKKLGTYTPPEHHLFTFQVVGIMNLSPTEEATKSLSAFTSEILGAHYGDMVGAIIPKQIYEKLADEVKRTDIILSNSAPGLEVNTLKSAGIEETIVEFTSLSDARSFLKEGCQNADQCNKQFVLEPYGSNYLLIDDLNNLIVKSLQIALPIAIAFAGLITWFTMTRVLIDSRRETAVFRAIGAKRIDITSIYLLYSLLIAVVVAIFAIILGASIAITINDIYGSQLTSYANVAYGVFNQEQGFNLIGLNPSLLVTITLCIIVISLVAVTLPLARNVRRNPIDDMRDE